MADDVILGKVEIVERCLKRIDEIYQNDPRNLRDDQLKQDALLLNLQRACQAIIDLGMRIIRMKSLGIPKESRETFLILEQHKIISKDLSTSLQKMVGFRNIAIHDYQALNLDIVESVLKEKTKDLSRFTSIALKI